MKKVFRGDISNQELYYTTFTPGKIYKVLSIKTLRSYPGEIYTIKNDNGDQIDVSSRLFRELNKQEYREQQLCKIGL